MEVSIKVKKDDWIELVLHAENDVEWLALRRWLDEYVDGKNAGIEVQRNYSVDASEVQ